MKEQFAKAYDGVSANHTAKRINADIEEYKGKFHIVALTKVSIDDGVIVIWESNEDVEK